MKMKGNNLKLAGILLIIIATSFITMIVSSFEEINMVAVLIMGAYGIFVWRVVTDILKI